MSAGEFQFCRTSADGTALEAPQRLGHRDVITRVSLECPRMPARQLAHYLALAAAAPGHPVDVTHWEDGRLMYAARIERVGRV